MSLPARLARRARRDLAEAMRWIAREQRAASTRLGEAVREAMARIGDHPAIGSQRPGLVPPRVRLLLLRGFPYFLVYRDDTDPPTILRLLHAARDLPPLRRDLPDA